MRRVLAIGVFDLLHVGHLRYLQYAKAQGASLTVAVTPDEICYQTKGKNPTIVQEQRKELVSALACVDDTKWLPGTTENTQEAAEWIKSWGVDVVVVGGGWEGSKRWQRLRPLLEGVGIEVSFAPATENISTTDITQRIQELNGK
ncbi:adenylyltransferase/cytidyltransferase family protein [Pseudomaricurvus alkylphenolicus]|uniref:adenylyltransferase/cytidyltransferase family protein n=1 Tax=Pseudomaricurvus alkylphenolicus TaxID=1306991 RepID=UPI0014211967|nr:adenylyltransferase/cytidyltransferase family protein [Pseudomaricurvus alkylphenolicus]NIB42088.1 adenylyltransferase/cytidyltransferase family protein [Pseudomaricurvus alkylphenolicus]